MRSASTRPQVLSGLALVAAAILCLPQFSPARADEPATPKPTKKDSNPRIRPPEVTLTPSVTPTETKVGGKVTYQVTARLDPGWPIYASAKQPHKNGPRTTPSDVCD